MKYVVHMIQSTLPNGSDISLWIRKISKDKFSVLCRDKKIPGYRKISMPQWIDLLDVLFNNAFISFGGKIYKKKIGMPQGIHPAPKILNMHFSSYELEFALKAVLTEAGRVQLVAIYSNMMRLIDDIAVFGTKHAKDILGLIYPSYVILEDTWITAKNGQILGHGLFLNILLILHMDQTIEKQVSFKEDKLPFAPIQYIQAFSNRSFTFSINTILSQIIVSVVINDTTQACCKHFKKLVTIFMKNGFSRKVVDFTVSKYLVVRSQGPAQLGVERT
jgi:hypothetical protein